MKIIYSILLILNSSIIYSQWQQNPLIEYKGEKYWKFENYDSNYVNTPLQWYIEYDSLGNNLGHGQLFTKEGRWINFYKQDTNLLASIFEVHNHMLNGKSKTFYSNGQIEAEVELKNNELNGFWKEWYPNGQLRTKNEYKLADNNYSENLRKREAWYENGNLKREVTLINDLEIGPSILYYPDKKIKLEEHYKNGVLDSICREFHSNGSLHTSYFYKDGIKISIKKAKEYHPNGRISASGEIKKGLKSGYWKYYYLNGELKSKGRYIILIEKEAHGDFDKSNKTGMWYYYYPNGNIMAYGEYDEEKGMNFNFSKDDYDYKLLIKDHWKYFSPEGKEIDISKFESMGNKIVDEIDYDD